MILQPLVNQQLGQNMIHLHPDRAHLPFINIKIWLPTTRFGYLQLASVTFNLLLHLLHFLVTVQFHSLDSPVDLVFDRSLIFALCAPSRGIPGRGLFFCFVTGPFHKQYVF